MTVIVASLPLLDLAQADGRRWVTERHQDGFGSFHYVTWMALANADLAAARAAHAAQLEVSVVADEIGENVDEVARLGRLATPTLRFSVAADNFAALRLAYVTATDREVIMIGDFLSSLSDPQLRVAFGMTLAQVTALRASRLTPAASLADGLRAAAGQ